MQKLRRFEDILLFLTLLFLPTQLGRHFWPDSSYIYSLKVDYLSPTLFFWDLPVILLMVFWIFQKPKINKAALNIFFLFILTQAVSLFSAQNLNAGFVRLEQYIIAGLFGVYVASQKKANFLYLPLILGLAGESIIALLQFLNKGTLGLWILGERTFTITTPGIAKFDFYGKQFLRPYATFPHPNVLAAFLLVISSLVIRKPIILILTFLSVFLTMSRTAIFIGFVLLLFFRKKSITFITIIIFIIIIISPVLFIRFSSILNFDNLTLLRREELTVNAWDLFLKNPLTGIGLNNFIPAVANNLVSGPNRFLQPVHNIFLLTLSETGLIGLGGFLLLIGYPIKKIFNFQFSIFNLIPWLIILFLGMFDHYFLTLPQGYRLLFLVWGVSLSRVRMIR